MRLYFQICVMHFLSKTRKLNMTPIFGEEKIFLENWRVVCLDTLWLGNFNEIALSHMFKVIEAVL